MEGGGAKVRNKDRCLLEMDVIKAIDKHTREDGTLDDDISCILEEVESVDAKDTSVPGKWIPITERTPEDAIRKNANFTEDEEKVFEMASRGKTIVEIADKMNVSERTVDRHIAKVKLKIKKLEAF